MAEAYRGLTIRFAGDARSVLTTLRTMQKASANVASELKLVQRALRLDPNNTKAASRNIALLAEQAGLARGQASDLRKSLQMVGREKIDNVSIKKLAETTRNASSAAAIATARYNEINEELAILNKREQNLISLQKKMSANEWAQKYSAELKTVNQRQDELRASLQAVSAEQKKFNKIAQAQSLGDKYMEQAAKAKAALREVVAASKAARPTQYTEGIREANAATQKLIATGRQLKEAIKIDPHNVKLADSYIKNLRATEESARQQAKLLSAEIRELSSKAGVKKLASDFERLRAVEQRATAGLEQWGGKLQKLDAAYDRIEAEIIQTTEQLTKMKAAGFTATEGIEARLNRLVAGQERVRASIEKTSASYAGMQKLAQTAAMANQVVANETAMAGLAQTTATASNALVGYKRNWASMASSVKSLGMSMYSTFTPMAFIVGTYAIQSAKEVDGAYRNMRKTVNGTEEDFVRLKQAALEFGDAHFTSADEILQIEALGGQLGIAVDSLEKFAEVISNISIATDLDTETAALKLGQLSNILKLTKDDWDGFSDALVRLGNNSPTLESSIMNVMSRISPMGAIVKMNADELLGWSTAVASTGQKAEAAGTAVARTMSQIEQAVAMGSDSLGVFNDYLGMTYDEFADLYANNPEAAIDAFTEAIMSSSDALEFFAAVAEMSGDELQEAFEEDAGEAFADVMDAVEKGTGKLEDFADVAGMSADAFAALWEEDASEAMYRFIEGLVRIDEEGGSVDATLAKLKINSVRQKQALEGLTTTWDVLTDSLQMSNHAFNLQSDQWGDTGDAAREASRKAEGFSGTLQMLINNAQHLASEMGESLVPTLQTLLKFVQGVTEHFEGLSENTKQTITILALLPAISGPVITLFSSLIVLFSNLKSRVIEANTASNLLMKAERMHDGVQKQLLTAYLRTNAAIEERIALQRGEAVVVRQSATASKTSTAALKFQAAAYNVASKAVGAFKLALKTLAPMLVLDIAFKAITALKEYKEHIDNVSKATDGLRSALKDNASWDSVYKGTQTAVDGITSYKKSLEELNEQQEAAMQTNIELAQTIADTVGEAAIKDNALSQLSDALDMLNNGIEPTQYQLANMKQNIEEVNDAFGTNFVLVAGENGYQILTEDLIDAADAVAELQDELASGDYSEEGLEELRGQLEKINEQYGTTYELVQTENGYEIIGQQAADAAEQVDRLIEKQKEQLRMDVYSQLAQEAYQATLEQKSNLKEQEQALHDAQKALDDYKEAHRNAFTGEVDPSIELMKLDENVRNLTRNVEESRVEYDAASAALDGYYGALNLMTQASDESADALVGVLKGNQDLIDEFVSSGKDVGEFAQLLSDLGVDADAAANITGDAAGRMAQDYNGSLSSITGNLKQLGIDTDTEVGKTIKRLEDAGLSFEAINAIGLDPKEIVIKDNGTFKDQMGNIWSLNEKTVNGKKYTVSDGKTIQDQVEKIKILTKKIDDIPDGKSKIVAQDNATSVIKKVSNELDAFNRRPTITKYINVVERVSQVKNASGGIIPQHMAGGVLSGSIVTAPTLSNIGWVGEAGAEAIIPLSNKHYVRPFAQAVASEMGGSNTTNTYYINVDATHADNPSDIARAIVDKLKAKERLGG